MSLKHCIIHKIERLQPATEVVLTLAEKELDPQSSVFSLYQQLRVRFMRSAQKRYGHFDPEQSANPCHGLLKDYLEDKSSFTTYCQKIMANMKSSYQKIDDPFSAHVLFAFSEVNFQPELLIFWINYEEVMKIGSDLKVSACQYINTGKLQFVVKIKTEEFMLNQSQRYMSVYANRGNKDITQAFMHFCGFVSVVDLVKETDEFLQIVDQFSDEIPDQDVSAYKDTLLNYCIEQDKEGLPVVMDELSELVNDQQPEQFSSFVADNQQQPQAQFHPDRSRLKKYVRYYGRDKNLSISFAANMYGQQINYHADSDTLSISQIPKSLKAQLKKNH